MTIDGLGRFVVAVQTNCHIADARHAADLSLCIYLLQMREFYRWEHGLALGAALDRDAVGRWLAGREALWTGLEGEAWRPLPWGERGHDPFDVAAINACLAPHRLVYGAGLEGAGRPMFFLAELQSVQRHGDALTVQVAGRELARGLFAPPAALAGGDTIVLRQESLARWLWEKFEAFSLRRNDGPFKALADAYGLRDSEAFAAALPRMLDEQSQTLLLHELGEFQAGRWLEPQWAAMRMALEHRRAELHVRAVRDHIADLEVTLPQLLERGADTAIHFWFAGFEGIRERLYPSLPAAYRAWCGGDRGAALSRAAAGGAIHFRALAQQVLQLHQRLGQAAGPAIERLLTAPDAVCAA